MAKASAGTYKATLTMKSGGKPGPSTLKVAGSGLGRALAADDALLAAALTATTPPRHRTAPYRSASGTFGALLRRTDAGVPSTTRTSEVRRAHDARPPLSAFASQDARRGRSGDAGAGAVRGRCDRRRYRERQGRRCRRRRDPAASTAGLQPTIHWQEAQAHERDRIAFTPGGRVTVGFKPRSTDRWTVGGVRVAQPARRPARRQSACVQPDPAPESRCRVNRPSDRRADVDATADSTERGDAR